MGKGENNGFPRKNKEESKVMKRKENDAKLSRKEIENLFIEMEKRFYWLKRSRS